METPAVGAAPATRNHGALTLALAAAVAVLVVVFAFDASAVPNHWYALFKTIHVVAAIVWLGGGILVFVLGVRAQRASNVEDMTAIARFGAFAGERIFAPAGLVVVAMGVAMMINTDWGWGTFWIDAGLVGYATTFVTGVGFLSPTAKKIAAAEPGSPEALALIDRVLLVLRVDVAVLLLVIADMVTKPFS
ncbi:MAG TPA: DUF2269 family protein [Gaiellaceae bacterium]|nr:DUF2269 family protein [Gaiellaceae bacterium]